MAKLPERQKLTTSLARLSKHLRVVEAAGEASCSIAASSVAPLIVRATFGMANHTGRRNSSSITIGVIQELLQEKRNRMIVLARVLAFR